MVPDRAAANRGTVCAVRVLVVDQLGVSRLMLLDASAGRDLLENRRVVVAAFTLPIRDVDRRFLEKLAPLLGDELRRPVDLRVDRRSLAGSTR